MMLSQFWESAGQGLAENWLNQLLGPAFLFWGGGLLIYVFKYGIYRAWTWVTTRDVLTQSAILIVGILILAFSTSLMKQLRFTFLRILEGYWIWPFNYLGLLAIKFNRWRIMRDRGRWNKLMGKKESGAISTIESQTLSRLELRGHYSPADLDDCMPTTLGNVLASAEAAPRYKYGLDAVVCWPRIWMLLPDGVQGDLSASRQRLDTLVELCAWGLLFLVWSYWWIWTILVSVLWMIIAYVLAVQAAQTYADLLDSTFDIYRWDLYTSLRWPEPKSSGKAEILAGNDLSQYLWRRYLEEDIKYTKKEIN